jgi:glycosyltransferase involved in cell wall biosynthesis
MEQNQGLPRVTVGIPTYNRPRGLAKTLARVTAQTYPNLEILVSDNCSPDELAVRDAVAPFLKHDPRICFHRQSTNLGSIGNFHYLLQQAKGEYFCWAADDDEIDATYIETLVQALRQNPGASVSMTGYTVDDVISDPPIFLDLTKYLYGLQGETPFLRLQRYIRQPDHLGKSRLVWGLFRRTDILRSFHDCMIASEHVGSRLWCDLPIEFRILSYGDLAIDPQVLFHVCLLPTSEGKKGLSHSLPQLLRTARRGYEAYAKAVLDTPLPESERKILLKILFRKYCKDSLQLAVYYGIIAKSPAFARWLKKLWYLASPIFYRTDKSVR